MQTLLTILQIFLAFCNSCIMLFLFKNFLSRPRNDLADRITKVEIKVEEVQESLKQGNDKFRDQKMMNEVFINCMLAFIDFEIAFCQSSGYENSSDLMKAKTTLQDYLAKK